MCDLLVDTEDQRVKTRNFNHNFKKNFISKQPLKNVLNYFNELFPNFIPLDFFYTP